MKTTSLSRFTRLGLCLSATFLASFASSREASAQAQCTAFSRPGFRMQAGQDYGWYPGQGDVFSSSGSDSAEFSIESFDYPNAANHAFEDEEQIDPTAFTWSDDPRDPFASKTSDDLAKYPLYRGSFTSFSFVKVADGKTEKPESKRSFAPPAAVRQEHPKYVYFRRGLLPDWRSHPVSGDIYRDAFGNVTALHGWPVTRKVVRVYFAGDVGVVRDGLVKRVFVDCMKQWCNATRGNLKFTVIEDSRQADIILCREFTSNYELAENNPTFHNGWLDRVKIRLLDSTCDKISEAQLRAVLLHSAGHSIGYFRHTTDKNSAMNERCAHIDAPTQKLCPCDSHFINRMYDSYKRNHEEQFKKPVDEIVKVPWGHSVPPMTACRPDSMPPKCPSR